MWRFVWVVLLFGPRASAAPEVVPGDPAHQLVLDQRVIQQTTNATLRLGTIRKEGGTLLPADQPWENATNNLYPNVQFDPDTKRWRLWYKCVVHDAAAIAKMHQPKTVHDQGWYLLYAESDDGVKWTKPRRPAFPFDGQPTNAVAQDTPNVGVFRDARETDPAKRFKMIFDTGLGEVFVRFSKDGLTWAAPIAAKGFGPRHGDTHNNAFWDDRLQRYVLFTKHYLGERLVARFESKDFVNWTDTGLALRSLPHEGKDTQTYCLTAFPYGNLWLGYVMLYHVGTDRRVSCELAWSADSVTWERVAPGQVFIPFGAAGSGDAACIYAQAGPAYVQGDRVQLYYGGSDTTHVGWKRHCLLRRATLRRDGFAGFAPTKDAVAAEVITQPLCLTSPDLLVRCEAAHGGSVRVAVLDDPTFGTELSEPLTADGVVRWTGKNTAKLVGRRVRLKFVLDRATLYSFVGATLLPSVQATTGVRHFADQLTLGLTVAPATSGAVIRYTTDGTEPTATAPLYKQPLELTATTRVQARAFVNNDAGPVAHFLCERRDPTLTTQPPRDAKPIRFEDRFHTGSTWKGIDTATWHTPDGAAPGFVRVTRAKPHTPFATFSFTKTATPTQFRELHGDWAKTFGSPGLQLSWQMRTPTPGSKPRVEIIAADSGGWFRELPTPLTADWQTSTVPLRFDWTDDEAKAAGWQRTTAAFSWRDTVRYVSKLVLGPSVHGQPERFDVTAVQLETMWPRPPQTKGGKE